MPGQREKSQIFHVSLLKPYRRRVEVVNVLISEIYDKGLEDADLEIPYPNANPDGYDFSEILRDSGLEEQCSEKQIERLRTLLNKHKRVFSNDPGRTDMIEHDIELISDKPVYLKPYRTSP